MSRKREQLLLYVDEETIDNVIFLFSKGFSVAGCAEVLNVIPSQLDMDIKRFFGIKSIKELPRSIYKPDFIKRNEYYSLIIKELIDDKTNGLKRVSEILPPVGNTVPEDKRERVLRLIKRGYNIQYCSKKLGLCERTIKRIIVNS